MIRVVTFEIDEECARSFGTFLKLGQLIGKYEIDPGLETVIEKDESGWISKVKVSPKE